MSSHGVVLAADAKPPSVTAALVSGKVNLETWRQIESGDLRELLVVYRDPAIQTELRSLGAGGGAARSDYLAVKHLRYRDLKERNLAVFEAPDMQVLRDFSHLPMHYVRLRDAAALRRLLARPDVAGVHALQRAQPVAANLDLIGQPQAALLLGQTGSGATMAILDTGVNYTTSTFGNCTAPGVPASCKVVAALDTGSDDGALDSGGHGTAVAGVALSAAPGGKIAALDVCDPAWGCNNLTILTGINWAIANRPTHNIVAINLSLSDGVSRASQCAGVDSYGLETAVGDALDDGIVTVAGSGNNGYVNGIGWPACVPGVVSVGAVYDANIGNCTPGLKDTVACFSNVASYLSLLTPAGATSFAAPLATAAVAVLAAAQAGESAAARVARISASGKPVIDNRPAGLGYVVPRLDMAAALLYPDTGAPANDDFAYATALTGNSGASLGWNHFASLETGEPAHAATAGAASVWWQWTPAASGTATLDTHGSNFDTLLAVYTGAAVDGLAPVAANDDDGYAGGGGVSGMSFHAEAGIPYSIAIAGKTGATGNLYLNRAFSADPAGTVNLSLTLADAPDPVAVGATLAYTLTVRNSGPATATGVTASLTLPAGTAYQSGAAGCAHAAGLVTCALGSLAAGAQLNAGVWVTAQAPGSLLATASVTSTATDGNPANNSATAITTVTSGGGEPGDGDVPLPAWSLLLLGAGLAGGLLRRVRP